MSTQKKGWVRHVVDYGPLIVFFVSYKIWGLMPATAVLVVASVLALGIGYSQTRRLAWAPLITTIIVVIFGGLTLLLNNETFVKMKATIIEGLFSATLWIGLLTKRPLLHHVMGEGLRMDEAGWRRLELRLAVFFAGMAGLNELVWRNLSTDIWVDFKVFGLTGLTMLFMLMQIPLIRRHQLPDDPPAAETGPAGGDV